MHINVTAEGVENYPQLAFLQEQECQDAQGFLLSRPLQADAARELLRRVGELGDASRTQRLKIITG
jgi:EAL domain-containing protein (putative c-di-GMP-specific phosphodiesterase class I)